MTDNGSNSSKDSESLRDRISHRGEEAIGRIANELLGNPVVTNAIQGVMEASEKVSQAQDMAMGALNLPKAADVEKLQRRIRSLSERVEKVEDAIDEVERRATALNPGTVLDRLQLLEERVAKLTSSESGS